MSNNRPAEIMEFVKSALSLLAKLVAAPDAAFAEMDSDKNAGLGRSFFLYGVYLLVSLAFYALKPADFPPQPLYRAMTAHFAIRSWLVAEFGLGSAFLACWVFLLSIMGPLAARMRISLFCLACAAIALLPAGVLALFKACGAGGFLLAATVFFLFAGLWFMVHTRGFPYRKLLSLLVATSSLDMMCSLAQIPAVLMRLEAVYSGLEVAAGLWILVLTVRGVQRFCEIGTEKAAVSVFFSLLAGVIIIVALSSAGIIPPGAMELFFPA
ncbi:MAG: hypothetical protein PHP45_04585 [Elusimicrobiales bacterium]|nr:hypothetical protein [Elusimicrobiales bacterium]